MLLNIKGLNVNLGGKKILNNISFNLDKGEVISILGHNGSGKTTLLKSIIGLIKSKGKIIFEGKDIHNLKVFERSNIGIAYIMQEIPEYVGISVYNYLKNILKDKFDEDKISKLFDLFGLDYQIYKKRDFDQHLSGGEKKKIEIITNFMLDKKLYLLDEVETSLDATSRNIVINLILEKVKDGTSFIIVSHNQDLIQIASKGILLCNGNIQETGNITELFKKYVGECKDCELKNNCDYNVNKD